MRLDDASWPRVLAALPEPESAWRGDAGEELAVAFINFDDYAARRGSAWLWWPGGRKPGTRSRFDGRYPAEWGMLLVMSELALETICTEGEACLAGLVRRLEIKPFLLQQRGALEAAGILDFIESLELATPKH